MIRLISLFILFSVYLFEPSVAGAQSALSQLAASMLPGTWAQLSTNSMTPALFDAAPGHIHQYIDSATWDPIGKKVLYIGGSHTDSADRFHFLQYDVATNTWSRLPDAPWFAGIGGVMHGYDHNTIDQGKRILYYRRFGTPQVHKYNIATGTWSRLPDIPASIPCCFGLEYFPEMGGLVAAVGAGYSLWFWNESTNQWSSLGSGFTTGDYHMFAQYNPVHKTVLFGGGNGDTNIHKLNSNGSVTTLTQAPLALGLTAAITSVDPVTGKYLILGRDGNGYASVFKSYDIVTDTWTSLPSPPFAASANGNTGFVHTAIPEYGVTMYIYYNFSDPRVYIYKHSSGTLPPPPPPTFDFTVSNGGARTVNSGQNISNVATATLSSGTSQTTGFAVSGLPTGATGTFSQTSCNPTCSTTLTISTLSTTPASNSTVNITAVGGSVTKTSSFTLTVNASTTPPPPPPTGYSMPSLQNEKDAYTRWGWAWSSARQPTNITEPTSNYSVSDPDIHGDTEGDDLWTYLWMYRRGGNSVYLNRANAWASYFKANYINCVGDPYRNLCYDKGGYDGDHIYGWGLLDLFEYNGDSTALNAAISLATWIETFYSNKTPGSYSMTTWGIRRSARHLLLVTRLAEVTGSSRWAALRNKILDLYRLSPDWDTTQGMYFVGQSSTDDGLGADAYAAGWRGMGAFQPSMLSEAFYQAYRTTSQSWLKDRIVSMARHIQASALNPSTDWTGLSWWININTGSRQWFGIQPGYTTALVNALVLGYKLSGDSSLFASAKHFFARGTKWDLDGARLCTYYGGCQSNSDNDAVHHFVDTQLASGTGYFYFYWNKGELQYAYHIFENGGNPSVEGTPTSSIPTSPTGLTLQ